MGNCYVILNHQNTPRKVVICDQNGIHAYSRNQTGWSVAHAQDLNGQLDAMNGENIQQITMQQAYSIIGS